MSNLDRLSVDDVIEPFTDEHDEYIQSDYPGGTTPDKYSLPDQSPQIELVDQMREVVREEIERERKQAAGLAKNEMRVDTNVSGEVLFSRYSVTAMPIQICREKPNRGRVLIRIVPGTEGVASIGRQVGVTPDGTDTCTVVADFTDGVFRDVELRTRRALWATSTDGATIEVIEEFD